MLHGRRRWRFEKGTTFDKKRPLPGTQQGRALNLGPKTVFPKRLGSNFEIAMVGATEPINPVNPFFYSFGPFFSKIRKILKSY